MLKYSDSVMKAACASITSDGKKQQQVCNSKTNQNSEGDRQREAVSDRQEGGGGGWGVGVEDRWERERKKIRTVTLVKQLVWESWPYTGGQMAAVAVN